jgi:hypothetical protein
LTIEEDRSEALEKSVNDNLARAEDAEGHAIDLQTDLQAAEQELSILRVCFLAPLSHTLINLYPA